MNKFAVFDIDGTLIRWQLYHALADRLAKRNLLGDGASHAIKQTRRNWKNRQDKDAYRRYEMTLVQVFEDAIHTIDLRTFDSIVIEVIDEYKNQTYIYTKQLLRDLKAKGYLLFIVSGSHHELIEQLGRYYQFDDWIGSRYERNTTQFTGEKTIASFDKASALKILTERHGAAYADSYAVGDTHSDTAMLELVDNPIAFNPDKQLFDTASQRGWNIVIERKNMIYTLEKHGSSYVLA